MYAFGVMSPEFFSAPSFTSIHQGLTDHESTGLVVVVEAASHIRYEILNELGDRLEFEVISRQRPPSIWQVDQITVTGLQLNMAYQLRVFRGDSLIDQRIFRALDTAKPESKIAVISCTSDASRRQKDMWDCLYANRPDAIFCVGDAVYVNDNFWNGVIGREVQPELIWDRFIETRNRLEFFRFPELIPLCAIWDDHDYGVGSGGYDYRHREESRLIFETFFPRRPLAAKFEKGPGIAFRWDAFNMRFLFLDDRSFRIESKNPEIATHWGPEQTQWIEKQVRNSTTPVWLMNGTQFFGTSLIFDSVQRDHPLELDWLLRLIESSQSSVTLLSGDVHYSEIVKLPQDRVKGNFYELTSSAMHTTIKAKWVRSKEGRQAWASGSNFMLISLQPLSQGELRMQARCLGLRQQEFFQMELVSNRDQNIEPNTL